MTTTAGHSEDDKALIGEYALGLLDAAEHRAVEQRLAAEPALRAELALWRLRLSSMDSAFEAVAAPSAVLPALEKRLFGSQAGKAPTLWESLTFWRALATGGLAVAVIAVGFNISRPTPLGPQEFAAQFVAALEEEGSDVKFIALYDQSSGSVRLTALSGSAVPEKDFELWYIAGADAPVSMGVVPVNARSQIELPPEAKAKIEAGTVLAITLEPKGGSPSGAPTGPLVAKGAATVI